MSDFRDPTVARVEAGGRLRVETELGRGAAGVVYRAFDVARQERVAVKCLLSVTPAGLFQMKKEFRSLSDLRHPNLVELFELHVVEGMPFYTMELVQGVDFVSWSRGVASARDRDLEGSTETDRGEFAASARAHADAWEDDDAPAGEYHEGRVRSALAGLVRGVRAIHAAQLVHRDLKPSNVLVTERGRVVILDFGLATVQDTRGHLTATNAGSFAGTPRYMAPEQAGTTVGPPADWYGVGCMLYEALTGRPAFDGAPMQVLMRKQVEGVADPRASEPRVPGDLAELVLRLGRVAPTERPSDGEMAPWDEEAGEPGEVAPPATSLLPDTGSVAFVGRGSELTQLHLAAHRRPTEGGRFVVVEGEAGSGKATLIAQFLVQLGIERKDCVVLRGRCRENEHVAFNAFDGVVDELSRHLARLPAERSAALLPADTPHLARLFPVLRRVGAVTRLPPPEVVPGPEEARRLAFRALRELLVALAAESMVLVLVEAWQWADAESALLLDEVFSRLGWPRGVVLCVSARTDAGEVFFLRRPDVQRVVVGAMSDDDALYLAETTWGLVAEGAPTPDLLPLVRSAAGNPMLLGELVRHRASNPKSTNTTLVGMAQERIEALSPSARRILDAVGCVGVPVAPDELARVVDLPVGECRATLRQLARQRLVRGATTNVPGAVEISQEHIGRALAGLRDEGSEVLLASRWADALVDRAGGRETAIALLVRARRAEEAGELALRAAGEAEAALAFERAVDLYRAAIRLLAPPPAERARLLASVARSLAAAGRGREAAEVWIEAAADARGDELVLHRRRAATQLAVSGQITRGIDLLREELRELGIRFPTSRLETLLHYLGLVLRLRTRGLAATWRDPDAIPPAARRRMDLTGVIGRIFGTIDPMLGSVFDLRELLDALRWGDKRRATMTISMHAAKRSAVGRFEESRTLIRAARSWTAADDQALERWVDGFQAVADYTAGRLERVPEVLYAISEHWLRIGLQLMHGTELDVYGGAHGANWCRTVELAALQKLGDLRRLRERADELVRDADRRGDQYLLSIVGLGANLATLLYEGPAAARELHDRAAWVGGGGVHSPYFYSLRARGEIALREGTRTPYTQFAGELRRVRRSLLVKLMVWRSELDFLEGRLALAELDASGGSNPKLLRVAHRRAQDLLRLPLPFARVWGAALLGSHAACVGQPELAADHFATAAGEARGCGLRMMEELARYREGTLRHPAGSSAREHARRRFERWALEQELPDVEGLLRVYAPGPRRATA